MGKVDFEGFWFSESERSASLYLGEFKIAEFASFDEAKKMLLRSLCRFFNAGGLGSEAKAMVDVFRSSIPSVEDRWSPSRFPKLAAVLAGEASEWTIVWESDSGVRLFLEDRYATTMTPSAARAIEEGAADSAAREVEEATAESFGL